MDRRPFLQTTLPSHRSPRQTVPIRTAQNITSKSKFSTNSSLVMSDAQQLGEAGTARHDQGDSCAEPLSPSPRTGPHSGVVMTSCNSLSVVKPVADGRAYEFLTVGGERGARFLLVSDPEAVFAAACLNMQAGYFDDPEDVPGFAHWLEHAVHLGSGRYPDDKDYKYFLSQHGGTSNASTGMVHTSYHFTVAAPHLAGALDRLARFFIDPLLQRDSILKEAENVNAEFSRNCNSDARKLLQLRRSAAGGLLGKFSTGNATTLLERPAAAGADVPSALAAFWGRRYLAGALCGCVVGPQGLDELRRLVEGSFAGVRLREGDDDPWVTGQRSVQATAEDGKPMAEEVEEPRDDQPSAAGDDARSGGRGTGDMTSRESPRYDFGDMCLPGRLGRLFRVGTQRELRQLEVMWYLPYGMMPDIKSKPWRWAGHMLGHEGRGSLAALLRGAGLAQELSTGPFDEVRLGRGFTFWGATITLSEAGLTRVPDVLRLVFAAVRAMRALSQEQRRVVWTEVAEAAAARWHYQDRTAPLDLAKDAAQRLHYFGPQLVLSGNSLLYQYDAAALERFLSYITPSNCNVYLSDSSFSGTTDLQEQWYGARYSEEPLNVELYGDDGESSAVAATTAADVDTAGAPDDPYEVLLSRLRLPQPPSWALPVDVRLVAEPTAGEPAGASGVPTTTSDAVAGDGNGGIPAAAAPSADAAGGCGGVGAQEPSQVTALAPPSSVAAAAPVRPVRPRAPPELLEDSGSVRLWHRTDVTFRVPKTHVFVHLITRAVYDSPAAWVTARLACRLMEELLQPDVYDAQLVGTRYSLSASETGLHLSFHGFTGAVSKLAEVVAAALENVTLEQVQARYGLVHGKLLRSLRLWRYNNPATHAEYGAEHVLQLPHWHVEDSIAVLEAALTAAAPSSPSPAAAEAGDPPTAAATATAVAPASVEGTLWGGESAAAKAEAEAAAEAGPVAVWEFLRGVGRGMALEVLVYGNSTEHQARDLCATLTRHLRPTGLGPDGWPATRILQLGPLGPPLSTSTTTQQQQQQQQEGEEGLQQPPSVQPDDRLAVAAPSPPEAAVAEDLPAHSGAQAREGEARAAQEGTSGSGPVLLRYLPANPNPSNTNSAVFFLCQVGEDDPDDPRPGVLLDLLARVASKPAFHELRTRQRLGYVVSLAKHRLGGGMGLAVRVQSPDRRPGLLRRRVAEWLSAFGEELQVLSPERLAAFKASLEEKYLEPPRSLAEAAAEAWQPIRYRSYSYRKAERKAAALRELGLQDLVRFYEQHACPASASARVLCCEIWGGGKVPAAARTAAQVARHHGRHPVAGPEGAAASAPGEATGTAPCGGEAHGEGGRKAPLPKRGAEAEAEAEIEAEGAVAGAAEGGGAGQVWRVLCSGDLAEVHSRLPHFCHSETLGVLRPPGARLGPEAVGSGGGGGGGGGGGDLSRTAGIVS